MMNFQRIVDRPWLLVLLLGAPACGASSEIAKDRTQGQADAHDAAAADASAGGDASQPGPTDSGTHQTDSGSQQSADAGHPMPGACATNKIKFTQATGCVNDGSVEFCVPKDDSALRDRLLAINPAITFNGSGGRAGCDPSSQQLAMYPTADGAQCTGDMMKDDVWADMCKIAAEPAVTSIVETFLE